MDCVSDSQLRKTIANIAANLRRSTRAQCYASLVADALDRALSAAQPSRKLADLAAQYEPLVKGLKDIQQAARRARKRPKPGTDQLFSEEAVVLIDDIADAALAEVGQASGWQALCEGVFDAISQGMMTCQSGGGETARIIIAFPDLARAQGCHDALVRLGTAVRDAASLPATPEPASTEDGANA